MKKFVLAAVAAAVLAGSALGERVRKELPFSKGVNLSGWMEYGRMNTLLYGRKDFEDIKSMGADVVRLPVWFEAWNDGTAEHKVAPECFEMIDRAVSWAEELGLHIIIDFHNDCDGSSRTDPKIEKVLLKVWPQIAARYKDSGSHVVYEVMNEPHFASGSLGSDIKKWGKIQGNVLKAIRKVDTKHAVIVGGGDWNSLDSMLALPDYGDPNLIYNFHDYTPFLFTHQGAPWTHVKRLTGIPFPYDKAKMPPLPKGANADEKREWSGYEKAAATDALVSPLDRAAAFANGRNAALMCNEFGVSMTYADPAERVNWYRMKCGWMDERNIIRVSWDYTQEFGVFKSTAGTRFPEDLNAPLVEAMGFTVPGGKSETWLSRVKESGRWTIYADGSAGLLKVSARSTGGSLSQEDGGKKCVSLADIKPYGQVCFSFGETCDIKELAERGALLEFYAKSADKSLDAQAYFRDSDAGAFPWRAALALNSKAFKADGKWHKVSVPLRDLADVGGWTASDGWRNGEGKFSWERVEALVFENGAKASKNGFMLRDIRLVPLAPKGSGR